jgi:hypothetical protein
VLSQQSSVGTKQKAVSSRKSKTRILKANSDQNAEGENQLAAEKIGDGISVINVCLFTADCLLPTA